MFCLPTCALAQDLGAAPAHGTADLSVGFLPDPRIWYVNAGGKSVTHIAGCSGYVSAAPHLDVNYSAGDYPLTIEARSANDVTLIVNGPDGSWYCNDDGGTGTNAAITFDPPMSGLYNIWVGTFYDPQGSLPAAELVVTELGATTDVAGSADGCLAHASFDATIPAGERVTILEVASDDAFYGDRHNIVGRSAIANTELSNWGSCWFEGDVTTDDGQHLVFYRAQFLRTGVAAATAEPACGPGASYVQSIPPGRRVTVLEIAPADAFYPQRASIVGLSGTVTDSLENQGGCWFAGDITTSSGAYYYFLRVQVRLD